MTELTFDLSTAFDLPVEVYDTELRLVDRVLSSDSVFIGRGTYFVEVQLPDGSQVHRAVKVGGEEEVEVRVRPEAEAIQPGPRRVQQRWQFSHPYRMSKQWSTEFAWLHSFRGQIIGDWEEIDRELVVVRPGGEVRPAAGATAIALRSVGRGLTMVPVLPGYSELLRYQLDRDGEDNIVLRARLADGGADALLGFLGRDRLEDAGLMAAAVAEGLLYEKVADPLAAAAGALALLRMNELDRLHDWTANLANWFPWLPDGAIIRAEHLAREGGHEEAVELLRRLPLGGLPVLSLSLAFAVDRLRTYSARWSGDRRLRRALVELTSYALATDFTAPVTTFTGAAPDSPEPSRPFNRPIRFDRPEAATAETIREISCSP